VISRLNKYYSDYHLKSIHFGVADYNKYLFFWREVIYEESFSVIGKWLERYPEKARFLSQ